MGLFLSGLGFKEDSDAEYEQLREAFILKNFFFSLLEWQTGYENIFLV